MYKRQAQNEFANIITLLLGITISFSMRAEQFVTLNTLMIIMPVSYTHLALQFATALLMLLLAKYLHRITGIVLVAVSYTHLLESSGPKSIIAPMPMNSRIGNASDVSIPTLNNHWIIPCVSPTPCIV